MIKCIYFCYPKLELLLKTSHEINPFTNFLCFSLNHIEYKKFTYQIYTLRVRNLMFWIATLVAEVFFGFEVSSLLINNKYDFLTIFAISIPVGISASTMIFFGCAMILGFNSFHLYIHIGGISAVTYIILMRKIIKKNFRLPRISLEEAIFGGISLLTSISLIFFGYRFYPRKFLEAGGSDIQEELAIMNSFYHGVNSGLVNIFKIRHPFCYKCVARSKWLTACHSAMLKIGWASTKMALIAPSILYMFSFCYSFLNVAMKFTDSKICSLLSLVVIFFAGGFGFYYWTIREHRNNSSLDFVFNYGAGTTEWSHHILHYILAYRHSQLAISISMAITYLLLSIYKKKLFRKEFTLIGLLIGFLPGIETQAYIASALFIALMILFNLPKDKKGTKELTISLTFFGLAHAASTSLQILQYFPRSTNAAIFRFASFSQSLYGTSCSFPVIVTWLSALGFTVAFPVLFGYFFNRGVCSNAFYASMIVFFVGNYVRFATYNRMNIFFFFPYCITLFAINFIGALQWLSSLPREEEMQGFLMGIFAFVFVAAVASGVMGYKRQFNKFSEYWKTTDEQAAQWIAENTPKKALFVCETQDFNIVSVLAGKVLMSSNERLTFVAGFVDQGARQESRQLMKSLSSVDVAPKVEYAINVGGLNQPWYIDDGVGNWTLEKTFGDITIFKRNLNR